jgi:hypothetical protein
MPCHKRNEVNRVARRGRPPSPRAAVDVQIKLRLYQGEDDDLIAFFSSIPDGLRAVSVKGALRDGARVEEDASSSDDDELLDALDGFVL